MKCKICNKKIGLIEEISCKCNKCNNFYCQMHRLSENHFCVYNYNLSPQEIEKYIEKNKCILEKVKKI